MTVAAEQINEEFGVSDATFPNSYWPVTSWSVGGALFLMVGLPLMEDFDGETTLADMLFEATYIAFVLFIIPQALAKNFATLIVTRFFSGGCVSILANTVCSMVCDMFDGEERRTVPVGLYIWLYLVGQSIGPVIGGAIIRHLHWRWIFYIQLICYGASFPFFFVLIRETRGPVILRSRAKAIRKKSGKQAYTREELNAPPLLPTLFLSVKRPFHMLFTEWVIFSFTLWSAFSFGTILVFTQSVEQVFVSLYGWRSYSAGYVQGAVVIGECLGWLATLYQKRLYIGSASRNTKQPGTPIPEARLYMSIVGSFTGMAGGMFVYAWTSYPSMPWIAPAIGLTMVGFGICTVVTAVADYVTDAYARYGGSAVAAVAFGENMFAAFLPLSAHSMYSALGFQWASTLLACLALMLSFAPVMLMIWGETFRQRSPFMKLAAYS
ncbi:hypothetical protein LTR28_008305 [Elasticomyces elasticus]|nr:hypothetical protein LTR28_008305 [Elasticomyces elasticus]